MQAKTLKKSDIRKAVRAYNKRGSTMTINKTAEALGVSYSKARAVLIESGANIRPRGRSASNAARIV